MKKKEVSHDRCDTSFFYLYGRPPAVRVCASLSGKPYSSVEGRKPFAGERRRWLCEFAPPSRESLISPLRGANFSPGRAPGGGVSLRPAPGKALFLRREAQTLHPGEHPAAAGVCAPVPGKPYFSVERRKPFTGESAWIQWEFAPHTRESLISPLRGANPSPGKAPAGCGSLRPAPGKALFFRRGAQTFHPEEPPAAAGVCASHPGKPYFSVERRKPFAGESARSQCEFAPPSLESLILPSRGANPSPGKAPPAV